MTPLVSAQKNPQSLDLLRESERALGLDRVEVRTLSASGALTRLDSSKAAAPVNVEFKVIDLERVRWEFDTPQGPSVTIVNRNGGWNLTQDKRTALPVGRISGLGLERFPPLLLLRIIRSADVRVMAPETHQNPGAVRHTIRLHRLAPPGAAPEVRDGFRRMTSAELVIDAETSLPLLLRYREQPSDWRIDVQAQIEFKHYKAVDGLLFPTTVIRTRGGVLFDRLDFGQIRPNAPVSESDFAP
ncbi:MAG TPA: hypothetical protein VLV83_14885 [Acidobacteriota bacterium]|nr:hypothetical protein [Acidobacteriota bacterium]